MEDFTVTSKGSYSKTEAFLNRVINGNIESVLQREGRRGVDALARATPRETGETALDWDFRVVREKGSVRIEWFNKNEAGDTNVAILLQYGHGTGTGGYVQGRDYINPAMKPVFDAIAKTVWKEVTGNG